MGEGDKGTLLRAAVAALHTALARPQDTEGQGPPDAVLHANVAAAYFDLQQWESSAFHYSRACQLLPTWPDALCNGGNACREVAHARRKEGDEAGHRHWLREAAASYAACLSLCPTHPHAWNSLGNAAKDTGRLPTAVACYAHACALDHAFAPAACNLGHALREQGALPAQCIPFFAAALRTCPSFAAAWCGLANCLRDSGNVPLATCAYAWAIGHTAVGQGGDAGELAVLLTGLGSGLKDLGCLQQARLAYTWALQLWTPQGMALAAHASEESLHAALHAMPLAHALARCEAVANLYHCSLLSCVWTGGEGLWQQVRACTSWQLAAARTTEKLQKAGLILPAMQPFHSLVYRVDPVQQRAVARAYGARAGLAGQVAVEQLRSMPRGPLSEESSVYPAPPPPSPLRVGFLSSDLGNHPLGHLMASLWAMMDRARIHPILYSTGPSEESSPWRQRIRASVDEWVDLSAPPYATCAGAAAGRIAQDRLHVLVNLNGYTKGARNEVCAALALLHAGGPVHVSYMGYCGTLGAPSWCQYAIVDAHAVPPPLAHTFDERLVYMPHSYFCTDHRQSARAVLDPTRHPPRASLGLPTRPGTLVLACHNQLYKTDPAVMACWVRILRRVPQAVLWLLRFPAVGELPLRQAAMALGLPAGEAMPGGTSTQCRLFFSDVAGKEEHLLRSSAADLFLDTPSCNAHTTACDALWAGVPMLTLPGQRMATRVAASVLQAAVPAHLAAHLLCSSLQEYEDKCVQLCMCPTLLHSIRAATCAWRDGDRVRVMPQPSVREGEAERVHTGGAPLFDTYTWVQHFSTALALCWERRQETARALQVGGGVQEGRQGGGEGQGQRAREGSAECGSTTPSSREEQGLPTGRTPLYVSPPLQGQGGESEGHEWDWAGAGSGEYREAWAQAQRALDTHAALPPDSLPEPVPTDTAVLQGKLGIPWPMPMPHAPLAHLLLSVPPPPLVPGAWDTPALLQEALSLSWLQYP